MARRHKRQTHVEVEAGNGIPNRYAVMQACRTLGRQINRMTATAVTENVSTGERALLLWAMELNMQLDSLELRLSMPTPVLDNIAQGKRLDVHVQSLGIVEVRFHEAPVQVWQPRPRKDCSKCQYWQVLNPHHIVNGKPVRSCMNGNHPDYCGDYVEATIARE